MSHVPLLPVFSYQVWQCGGSIEVLPCARIAHIERAHKPYTEDLTSHVRRNALRVAEVWMDEFKSHVYMAWNVPMEVSEPKLLQQVDQFTFNGPLNSCKNPIIVWIVLYYWSNHLYMEGYGLSDNSYLMRNQVNRTHLISPYSVVFVHVNLLIWFSSISYSINPKAITQRKK